jgi:imidazolonepropionase-like amidohydrolase
MSQSAVLATCAQYAFVSATLGVLMSTGCRETPGMTSISINTPVIAITHVRIIDGTGAPAVEDQTIVIQHGRISTFGSAAAVRPPTDARVVDGRGRTLFPGLVGMHNHLFYEIDGAVYPAQTGFARLYLASGVTTIRTAGTIDLDADLRLKAKIDAGSVAGPTIHVTGGYLTGGSGGPDPEMIARQVNEQADRGATSFKAYTSLRQSELAAAVRAAHARGLTVTGHLCAVGFRDAAAIGIDNLEHGLLVDTEFDPEKRADICPDQGAFLSPLLQTDMLTDGRIRGTIAALVQHGVAVTSTLAVFEAFTAAESAFDSRLPEVLAPRVRKRYEAARMRWIDGTAPWPSAWRTLLIKEMQFERAFVAAGGRLMAGVDPTGWGGVMAGFGDQRQLELLVEAGFTPEAAIRIASSNGAAFLREGDHIGTIAPGYQADLVLVRGNPSSHISDVRNVEFVFKNGVAYDPAQLIAATRGSIGRFDVEYVAYLLRWPYGVLLIGLSSMLALRILSRRVNWKRLTKQRRSRTRFSAT